jgi:hypothetical protein
MGLIQSLLCLSNKNASTNDNLPDIETQHPMESIHENEITTNIVEENAKSKHSTSDEEIEVPFVEELLTSQDHTVPDLEKNISNEENINDTLHIEDIQIKV